MTRALRHATTMPDNYLLPVFHFVHKMAVDMLLFICYIIDKVSRNTDWGWSKDPGPSLAGKFLALFISWYGSVIAAKELSVFIDESGDFGVYDFRCPFYIITMVFHDQTEK